ncbi:prepilin-type N-terminal cleavage/methylation domain-containing protein [Seongchinamella unica]|uniref:Type II secretion system protein H n=1 Tax=Seongchinamella unica TaxID=2547392 RepID=A0A4V6PIW5_9GAMM|nr:GspH/FimT family protein [Seongchinamella unica]TDG12373.1 prepilin-type N-terminal cleavage/methylation domain-containing protein [Seongchinamella unica]
MDGNWAKGYRRGFTLVELMVVLAVLGLLLGLGVPGFQHLQESTRIQAQVRQLMADIILTRSEAIKRNVQVVMCPSASNPGTKPECSGIFAEGWLIFEDRDRDRRLDSGEEVIRTADGLPDGLTLTNRAANRHAKELILFRPDGTSGRNRTLMICSRARPDIPSWSVVMNIIGRPRMARDWGECPTTPVPSQAG